MVGRSGPQAKQPFLVAFFKASEVLLRSVRAAGGGKRKNQNRNKSAGQQGTSRAVKGGGESAEREWMCTQDAYALGAACGGRTR